MVIARGAHLEAIRHAGLRLTSVAGDAVVHPAECAEDPAAVAPADVVLLGVKAWQVAGAAATLRPLPSLGFIRGNCPPPTVDLRRRTPIPDDPHPQGDLQCPPLSSTSSASTASAP